MATMMPLDHADLLLRILQGTRFWLQRALQESSPGFRAGYQIPWFALDRILEDLRGVDSVKLPVSPQEALVRLQEEREGHFFEAHLSGPEAVLGLRSSLAYLDHLHYAPLPPIAQFNTKPQNRGQYEGIGGEGIVAIKQLRSLSPGTSLRDAKHMVETDNFQVAFVPFSWLLRATHGPDGSWWGAQNYFRITVIGRPETPC